MTAKKDVPPMGTKYDLENEGYDSPVQVEPIEDVVVEVVFTSVIDEIVVGKNGYTSVFEAFLASIGRHAQNGEYSIYKGTLGIKPEPGTSDSITVTVEGL